MSNRSYGLLWYVVESRKTVLVDGVLEHILLSPSVTGYTTPTRTDWSTFGEGFTNYLSAMGNSPSCSKESTRVTGPRSAAFASH